MFTTEQQTSHSFLSSSRTQAILCLFVLVVVLLSYWMLWGSVGGFVRAMDHCNLLFCDFVRHYYPMAQGIFTEKAPVPGYIYSAFSAILLSPLGIVGHDDAVLCWGVLQVASAFLLFFLPTRKLLKIPPWSLMLYLFLFITSVPVLHNLKWGQMSIPVTLLIFTTFMIYQRKRSVEAGILLALATGIKYYPAVFLVVFAMKRDARFLLSYAIALVAFVCVLPAVTLGTANWLTFERASGALFSQQERVITFASNSQYLPHVLARLSTRIDPEIRETVLLLSEGVAALILILNAALIWVAARRGLEDHDPITNVVLPFLSLPFLLKTSWPHYFVYLPFCQTALLMEAWRLTTGKSRIVHSGIVLISVIVANVYVFAQFSGWKAYGEYGMLLLSNVVLLVSVYALYDRRWRATRSRQNRRHSTDVLAS